LAGHLFYRGWTPDAGDVIAGPWRIIQESTTTIRLYPDMSAAGSAAGRRFFNHSRLLFERRTKQDRLRIQNLDPS